MGDNIVVVGSNGVPIRDKYYDEINYDTDVRTDNITRQRKQRGYLSRNSTNAGNRNDNDNSDKGKGSRKKKTTFRPFFTPENPPPFQSIIPRYIPGVSGSIEPNSNNNNGSLYAGENSFSSFTHKSNGRKSDGFTNLLQYDQQNDRQETYPSNDLPTSIVKLSRAPSNPIHSSSSIGYQLQNKSASPVYNTSSVGTNTLNPETYIFSEQLKKIQRQQRANENILQQHNSRNIDIHPLQSLEQQNYLKSLPYRSISPILESSLEYYDSSQSSSQSTPPMEFSRYSTQLTPPKSIPIKEPVSLDMLKRIIQRPTQPMTPVQRTPPFDLSKLAVQRPNTSFSSQQPVLHTPPTEQSKVAAPRAIRPMKETSSDYDLNQFIYRPIQAVQPIRSIPLASQLAQKPQQSLPRPIVSSLNYMQQLSQSGQTSNQEIRPLLSNQNIYPSHTQQTMLPTSLTNEPMIVRPPPPSIYHYQPIPVPPLRLTPSPNPTIHRMQTPFSAMDPVYPEIHDLVQSYLNLDETLAPNSQVEPGIHFQVVRPYSAYSVAPRSAAISGGVLGNIRNSQQNQQRNVLGNMHQVTGATHRSTANNERYIPTDHSNYGRMQFPGNMSDAAKSTGEKRFN